MAQRRLLIIVAGIALFVVGGAFFYYFYAHDGQGKSQRTAQAPSLAQAAAENLSFKIPSDWLYQEAPNPDTTSDAFAKSRELWPDIGNPQPDEAQREAVRQQWREFAARFPKNIFIPNEFKKLSNEEKENTKKTNELAALYAARQAELRALEKYRAPGENPPARNVPPPDVAEQRAWLSYKINETRSLIEVAEYFLEKGNPDREQAELGKRDIARLRKQLQEYEDVLAQVPK